MCTFALRKESVQKKRLKEMMLERVYMHTSKYKYVSIVSAVAVLLLLGIYMWMTYRSVTKDIEERAGNQLMWAMFYESYTRADLVTAEDTLSLPQSRGNLSLASSVEGMNDALSRKYHSELSLDNVAMYVAIRN